MASFPAICYDLIKYQKLVQNWQFCPLGGSFLFFGASNGSIYYIDMEKFPLRMIDNDLLVSELFRDPSSPAVPITALSVYLPTKTKSFHGNSIGKSNF